MRILNVISHFVTLLAVRRSNSMKLLLMLLCSTGLTCLHAQLKIDTAQIQHQSIFTKESAIVADCWPSNPFLQAAPNVKLVVLGKVEAYLSPMAMQIQALDVFLGTDTNSVLVVHGGTANDCRPRVQEFGIGKFYVFALLEENKQAYTKPQNKKEYSINFSEVHWLSVDYAKQTVSGNITKFTAPKRESQTMSLAKLKKKLKNGL